MRLVFLEKHEARRWLKWRVTWTIAVLSSWDLESFVCPRFRGRIAWPSLFSLCGAASSYLGRFSACISGYSPMHSHATPWPDSPCPSTRKDCSLLIMAPVVVNCPGTPHSPHSPRQGKSQDSLLPPPRTPRPPRQRLRRSCFLCRALHQCKLLFSVMQR